jgi:hypothetical protein
VLQLMCIFDGLVFQCVKCPPTTYHFAQLQGCQSPVLCSEQAMVTSRLQCHLLFLRLGDTSTRKYDPQRYSTLACPHGLAMWNRGKKFGPTN